MRKTLLLSIFTMLTVGLSLGQRVYVNANATGANDGSSWQNAFTNLDAALVSSGNEVWIASGFYSPTLDDGLTSTFEITKNIKVYGGFNGSETALSQRNFNTNIVEFSGDINRDDDASDISVNRADNLYNVFRVDANLTEVIFDGVVISGGNTRDTVTTPEYLYRGGGIYSLSPLKIFNCEFKENFARSGGGIFISQDGNGDGSEFIKSKFYNNGTNSQGAGLMVSNSNNITVLDCDFNDNRVNRGAFYPIRCNNVTVDSCRFERNIGVTSTMFGGAIFNWNSSNFMVSNSLFANNVAGNAGCINNNGSELDPQVVTMIAENCVFRGNEATDFGGGAMYNSSTSYIINNCEFIDNIAANSASQVFSNAGVGRKVEITNSTFSKGSSNFGGAHSCYGYSDYLIKNNTYEDGNVGTSGGAVIVGFLSQTVIEDCTFTLNNARFGGAIYVQNDTTKLTLRNSNFLSNSAESTGGAILAGAGTDVTIENCNFSANSASTGGAFSASNSTFIIRNSTLKSNRAETQGAGINIFDSDGEVESSVFAGNINNGLAGGGVSLNAGDSATASLILTNNTFFDNAASIGGSIAHFQGETESVALLELNNNVFISEDPNYEVEDGEPTVISLGGNISSDNSMLTILNAEKDKNNIKEDIFIDAFGDDFNLFNTSIARDNGTANSVATDIVGNPRVGDPDAGAYEFQATRVFDTDKHVKAVISTYPNPTVEELHVRLLESWNGIHIVTIYDMQGKIVWQNQVNGHELKINVSQLMDGVYSMKIEGDDKFASTHFAKF